MNFDLEYINKLIQEVPDPEIPVLSVFDLGVIRNVEVQNETVVITITPTYSGCPAMYTIEADLRSKLLENGFPSVEIKMVLSPPWTTDWISQEGLVKLEEYGIAPPVKGSADKGELFTSEPQNIRCPQCKSTNTEVINMFGSTACKALYKCKDCLEPFDYFKCL
jgi:ring-1,2-phenylacetyl-CoA epoxidase subunit PaaD